MEKGQNLSDGLEDKMLHIGSHIKLSKLLKDVGIAALIIFMSNVSRLSYLKQTTKIFTTTKKTKFNKHQGLAAGLL